MNPKSLCIVGIGLMGASFAMALRGNERMSANIGKIIGISRSEETKRKALQRSIVDEATTDLAEGVRDADIVVLCTPVRLLIEQIGELGALCKPGCVITDMGSTKTAIVQAMNALPSHLFAVGSHPMCGKETAGIDVAEATLYQNAPWILTRTERTDEASFELIRSLAESVGAKPREIDVARHDALLSFASHLPYMLSTAMVVTTDAYAINNNAPDVWQVMAGGYRDTSRVAASDATMWLDILLTNGDAILGAVRDFQFQLDQFAAMLERRDEAGLKALMTQAAAARKAHYP
jgi:prephenate dehydrogenase